MNKKRELIIIGGGNNILFFAEALAKQCSTGWTRSEDEEAKARGDDFTGPLWYCFTCAEDGDRPSATILLKQQSYGHFTCADILPVKPSQLTDRQWNRILEDFATHARPCAAEFHLSFELTQPGNPDPHLN